MELGVEKLLKLLEDRRVITRIIDIVKSTNGSSELVIKHTGKHTDYECDKKELKELSEKIKQLQQELYIYECRNKNLIEQLEMSQLNNNDIEKKLKVVQFENKELEVKRQSLSQLNIQLE